MSLQNFPKQLTSFVGRDTERNQITSLLENPDCRLVSLVGPGGIGKTRLAIEIARQSQDMFVDGAFFVPLQALVSADNIVSAIASSLDYEFYEDEENFQEQILDYLDSKNLLLVLDNFAHVIEGSEHIAQILERTPQVKILVTSRETLKLQQEWTRPVVGMTYPDDVTDIDDGEAYSAIQLFVQRASQIRSHFVIEDELSYIIQICQLVGGMPLGIELAAAWVKTLSCAEIVTEIQSNLDLLTAQLRDIPERHQSIRAVFDSTWQMLSEQERAVFMRLSVFHSVPTRKAIQSITNTSLMTLSQLVDKALLIPTDDGRYQIHELLRQYAYEKLIPTDDGRYQIHELLRQYAYEKLIASDELSLVRTAHSDYYLAFLKERQIDLYGRRQVDAVNEISQEFENIRAAWYCAIEHLNYAGIGDAVEALCVYLHFRSRWHQDSQMLIHAQERFATQTDEDIHFVWAMVAARNYLNNVDAPTILRQCIDLAEERNERAEVGLYLLLMANYYTHRHNHEETLHYAMEAIPILEDIGDKYHLASAYGLVSLYYWINGDYAQSVEYSENSLSIRRAIGDIDGQAYATADLSNILLVMGDLEASEYQRREAILLAEQIGSRWNIAWQKWGLATYHTFGARGDLEETKQLMSEAEQLIRADLHLKGTTISPMLLKGLLAAMNEDYDAALKYSQEALDHISDDAWFPLVTWTRLVLACGQADYDTVHHYNCELLNRFWGLGITPLVLLGVSFSAILAAYQENNASYATQLLALASTHPRSLSGWLKTWHFIDRMQEKLELELGTVAYQQAWERGTSLDLEQVIPQLLSSDVHEEGILPSNMLVANAKLHEPLSQRELEVLSQIAEGHTNREIAEKLFVGVSTVKKHITHIYGKLQVENRTQALLRAQEVDLI